MQAGWHSSGLALKSGQRPWGQCEEKSSPEGLAGARSAESLREQLDSGMTYFTETKKKNFQMLHKMYRYVFFCVPNDRSEEGDSTLQGAEVTRSSMSSILNVLGTLRQSQHFYRGGGSTWRCWEGGSQEGASDQRGGLGWGERPPGAPWRSSGVPRSPQRLQ